MAEAKKTRGRLKKKAVEVEVPVVEAPKPKAKKAKKEAPTPVMPASIGGKKIVSVDDQGERVIVVDEEKTVYTLPKCEYDML